MESQKCSRIEIELAENGGFSVRKFFKVESKGDGKSEYAPCTGYVEPKTFAFTTLEDLSEFLHDTLGDAKKGRIIRKQG